jgi:EAL and modified HD-GYP domain-containing signal transduction protein
MLHVIRVTWSAIVARDHRPIGVRLALQRAMASSDGPDILPRVLSSVIAGFEAGGGAPFPRGLVVLAPLGFDFDDTLLGWTAPRNVLLEIGAEALIGDAQLARLRDLQHHGTRLVLRAAAGQTVDARIAGLFQYALASAQVRMSVLTGIGWLACGNQTRAEAEQAFVCGSHAVVGWPVDEAVPEAPGALQPAQKTVLELVRLLQAEADTADLERAFRAEPVLAYLLITLANSSAFRRGAPIGSVTQAITLLGYRRLLKWLILLLVIASKGSRALPQIQAAVARGFFIENLAFALDAHEISEAGFVAGAFSLLDRITGLSAQELFGSIDLPRPIVDAVLNDAGLVAPFLRLARALEGKTEPMAADSVIAPPAAINSALLQALAAADALQSMV